MDSKELKVLKAKAEAWDAVSTWLSTLTYGPQVGEVGGPWGDLGWRTNYKVLLTVAKDQKKALDDMIDCL